VTDDSDDEGVRSLLASTNSAKSLFANIINNANRKKQQQPLPVPPPAPKPRVVSTAELLLSPPLSPSASTGLLHTLTATGSVAVADPSAAESSSAAAVPAPAPIDYLSVLKRKGVAPSCEEDRAQSAVAAAESQDARAQIREHEAMLAALRAREKELMERKWKQIQQEEQAMGSGADDNEYGEDSLPHAGAADGHDAADEALPSAKSSARSHRSSRSHTGRSSKSASASSSASSSRKRLHRDQNAPVAAATAAAAAAPKPAGPPAWSNAPPGSGALSPVAVPAPAKVARPVVHSSSMERLRQVRQQARVVSSMRAPHAAERQPERSHSPPPQPEQHHAEKEEEETDPFDSEADVPLASHDADVDDNDDGHGDGSMEGTQSSFDVHPVLDSTMDTDPFASSFEHAGTADDDAEPSAAAHARLEESYADEEEEDAPHDESLHSDAFSPPSSPKPSFQASSPRGQPDVDLSFDQHDDDDSQPPPSSQQQRRPPPPAAASLSDDDDPFAAL